jgi:hypothetical protein
MIGDCGHIVLAMPTHQTWAGEMTGQHSQYILCRLLGSRLSEVVNRRKERYTLFTASST